MKILLVTESFAPATDSTAETARHLTDALLGSGHRVVVVTTGPGSTSYRGARVLRTRAVFSVAAIRRTVEEFTPDVVQVLRPRAMGAAAMRALEPTGVPVFVLDPTPLHPRIGTALASNGSRARVLAAAGIAAQVWAPGVRTDEHHPGLRSVELHDRWAKTPDRSVVGYVGPVGQPTAKAVRRLARIAALDGVRLVVLGSGPGTALLKEAGAKIVGDAHGLELARGIASLDLLVQPRKKDTSLTPVRKALASGVPVVAYRTGAAAELVRSGRTGLLVERTNGPDGLIATVARACGDPAQRHRWAAEARDSVSTRTWADAVEQLLGLYPPLPEAA